jgi:hypothetical protein
MAEQNFMLLPEFVYNIVVVLMIIFGGIWLYCRSSFLTEIEKNHRVVWSKLEPYRFPFTAFSDSTLEKFVLAREYEQAGDIRLNVLGNRLRIAQKLQIYVAIVAVIVLFGPILYTNVV